METKDRVREIIKSTGLSQDKFAAAYGIPKNTVHNWCQGINEPKEWALDLLAKEAASTKVIPMAWVWHEYRDKAGTGHFEVFKDRQEAEKAARDYWEHLGGADQRKYLLDAGADYSVGLYEMEWDDVAEEYQPDLGSGAVILAWSPINIG